MQHHAFAIEAGREAGMEAALAHAKEMLGIDARGNPDVVVLTYGLLSVEDARGVFARASGAPLCGAQKIIVIVADHAYHEAQNALLKLFEEPPPGTYLYLVLPTLGGLLPTLRSRVHMLGAAQKNDEQGSAKEFLGGGKEKRAALVQKLTSGKDEDTRRENRDGAIALINGIERAAYRSAKVGHAVSDFDAQQELLQELGTLRGYLHERAAPLKQILEHLTVVVPRSTQ